MKGITALNVGVTTRCNFTCEFCWGRHLPQGDIPLSVLEAVLDRFPDARYLDLTGEGEPLLHPQILEMARKAHSRGIRLGIYTNGSLLDRVDIDALLDAGFDSIGVSMESADPARFTAIRGGRLDIVMVGLRRLMERRRERGLALPTVHLAVSLLRDEMDAFDEIVALYRELGLDGGIVCQALNRMPGYSRFYPPELATQMLTLEEEQAFVHRVESLPESRRAGPGRAFFDELNEGFDPSRRACAWLERGLFVRHDGLVSPCCQVKEPSLSYGKIGEQTWEELAAARDLMRRELAEGVIPEACLGCDTATHAVAQLPAPPADDVALEEMHTVIARLRGEVEVLRRRVVALTAREKAVRGDVAAIRISRSWRLTRPLRWAHGALSRVLRRG